MLSFCLNTSCLDSEIPCLTFQVLLFSLFDFIMGQTQTLFARPNGTCNLIPKVLLRHFTVCKTTHPYIPQQCPEVLQFFEEVCGRTSWSLGHLVGAASGSISDQQRVAEKAEIQHWWHPCQFGQVDPTLFLQKMQQTIIPLANDHLI